MKLAFNAVKCLDIENFRIIALEKNPRAVLYLQKRKFEFWKESVEIVKDDMCYWKSDIVVDICISELLGSFGCNELSPECLLNIEMNNSKPGTIFIPQNYSSYIAPVSAPLLHQTLKAIGDPDSFEKPWIIHDVPYCIISTKINEVWSFQHPLSTTKNSLTQSTITDFKIKNKGEIHGLVGYFKAVLYGDICLSIVPNNTTIKLGSTPEQATDINKRSSGLYEKGEHTPNMRSWSPIIFPLKQPFFIADDTELEVFINRNHSSTIKKFWYEWSVSSFVYLVMSSHQVSTEKSPESNIIPATLGDRSLSSGYQNPPSFGIQKAFGHFHPSPNIPTDHGSNDFNDDSEMFEGATSDRSISQQQSDWSSVHDIHGLGIKNPPVFDLQSSPQPSISVDNSTAEEYHVRVKTGVSELHNVSGRSSSIQLR